MKFPLSKLLIIGFVLLTVPLIVSSVDEDQSNLRSKIISVAEQQIGQLYEIGEDGGWPQGFDNSGLINYSYLQAGVVGFNKTTANSHGPTIETLVNMSDSVSMNMNIASISSSIFIGDLVFLHATYDKNRDGSFDSRDSYTHVGLYIGNGNIIEAGSPAKQTSLIEWQSGQRGIFAGARRVKSTYWSNPNLNNSDFGTPFEEGNSEIPSPDYLKLDNKDNPFNPDQPPNQELIQTLNQLSDPEINNALSQLPSSEISAVLNKLPNQEEISAELDQLPDIKDEISNILSQSPNETLNSALSKLSSEKINTVLNKLPSQTLNRVVSQLPKEKISKILSQVPSKKLNSITGGISGIGSISSEKPFGGKITKVHFCTCSLNLLITIDNLATNNTGDLKLVYQPGISVLHDYYNIFTKGNCVLGTWKKVGVCLDICEGGCCPYPTDSKPDGKIKFTGTSLSSCNTEN